MGEPKRHRDGVRAMVVWSAVVVLSGVMPNVRGADQAATRASVLATTAPPFGVADDVHVVDVNELATLVEAPPRYVTIG
jgi:hypothetical protein